MVKLPAMICLVTLALTVAMMPCLMNVLQLNQSIVVSIALLHACPVFSQVEPDDFDNSCIKSALFIQLSKA